MTIGETYLEVDRFGKRRAGGDIVPFLQASYLGSASLYHGNLGDDENGIWLKEESNRLLDGIFLYFEIPDAHTLIANKDGLGRRTFINVNEPFFMPTSYFLPNFYKEFGDKKLLIDLSFNLLRNEDAYKAFLEVIDYRKGRVRPRFIMNVKWEKGLFLGKEEAVKERFAKIARYLDIIVADSASLKFLYGEKSDHELIKSLPKYDKKMILLFDREKVYYNGKLIYQSRKKVDFKKLRPAYYGVMLTLIDRDPAILPPDYLAQDHFLAMLAMDKASEKTDDDPFLTSDDLLSCIDMIRKGPEEVHEA